MAPSKPTVIPYWTDGAANKVAQPTAAAQAQGFTQGQPPPFEYVNWLFHQLGSWVGYLNEAQNNVTMSTSLNDLMRLINGGRWGWALGTSTLSWSAPFNLAIPSIADASNQAAAGSVTLADGQVAYVTANIPFIAQGNITEGDNQITELTYGLGISVGQAVTGPGINDGTVVTAISGPSVTISSNATATATQQTLTFSGAGALQVQVATGPSLVPSANTVIIARRVGPAIYLGINTIETMLRDGEYKAIHELGYMATVSRPAGMPLPIRTPVYVSQGGADATVTTANLTSGNAAISVADSAGLYPGMAATGAGIPGGAVISSLVGTAITLSAAATATASSVPVTFTRTAGALYACDASIAKNASRSGFVGFTVAGYASGDEATYVVGGSLSGFTNLTAGAVYYVDPSAAGGITLGRPSVVGQAIIPVGTAMGSTVLAINPCGASANQIVTSSLSWPNYSARNESELAGALAAAAANSGGVVLLLNAMTLSSAYTVADGVILQGRKAASMITVLAGGSIVLGDGGEMRDVYLATSQSGGTLVSIPGNYAMMKACRLTLPPTSTCIGIAVSGTSTRLANTQLAGVGPQSTATGIAYLAGADNLDDSTIILS